LGGRRVGVRGRKRNNVLKLGGKNGGGGGGGELGADDLT